MWDEKFELWPLTPKQTELELSPMPCSSLTSVDIQQEFWYFDTSLQEDTYFQMLRAAKDPHSIEQDVQKVPISEE